MKRIVCTLVAAALLTACSPETPSADPSVPTTPASTTPATPTPTTIPSASLDPAKDPLYLEAEKVYRAYFEEMRKVEASGYASPKWPKAMDQYLTGSMKEVIAESIVGTYKSDLRPAPGSTTQILSIAPNPGVQMGGSVVSISVCTDGRQVPIISKSTSEQLGYGPLLLKEVYFTRENGTLKGSVQQVKDIEKCPHK